MSYLTNNETNASSVADWTDIKRMEQCYGPLEGHEGIIVASDMSFAYH